MKRPFAETYHVARTFNAPLGFVYRWCTDFREGDLKMVGSRARRVMLIHTKKRVVWRLVEKGRKKGYESIRSVWMKPPDAWHLETCGDKYLVGDYKLTRLGRTRTRLSMKFTETRLDRQPEPRKSWEADTLSEWDDYARYLDKDYRRYLARAH